MPRGPSPYKGHPRSEWPAITARIHAERAQRLAGLSSDIGEIPPPMPPLPAEPSASEVFTQHVRQAGPRPTANFKGPQEVPRQTKVENNVDFNVPIQQPVAQKQERVYKPNLFSGKLRKLVLCGKEDGRSLDDRLNDPVPGYRTHWFVDQSNSGVRINQARATGWEHIQNEEVALMEGIGSNDLGSVVRQLAGVENGNPFYMYAMKKPLWLEAEHQDEYAHKMIAPVKDALIHGRLSNNPADRQFSASDAVARQTRSGLPPIQIGGTKTYR